jgi:hypothetical protein
MNIFQCSFEQRLRHWRNLRQQVSSLPIEQQCIQIDAWWQSAPLITRYLHINDQHNWPDPWTLLSENTYCLLTRALGISYTLTMCNIKDIKLVLATDKQANECPLVLVQGAKYILNYWPDMVLNNCLGDFSIKKNILLDLSKIKTI